MLLQTSKIVSINLLIIITILSTSLNAKEGAVTGGVDHIGLSVKNLENTTLFFTEALGWKLVGRDKTYPATFVRDNHMLISLWQVSNPEKVVEFNRKNNIGLHHLAISVESFEALDDLYLSLKKFPGVVIEFPPELAFGGPSKHMMIREPSGNRLEFRHAP